MENYLGFILFFVVIFSGCIGENIGGDTPVTTSTIITPTNTEAIQGDICKKIEPETYTIYHTLAPPETIISYVKRDRCYESLALRTNTRAFCDEIQDQDIKNECYNRFI